LGRLILMQGSDPVFEGDIVGGRAVVATAKEITKWAARAGMAVVGKVVGRAGEPVGRAGREAVGRAAGRASGEVAAGAVSGLMGTAAKGAAV
jgi:hypothetical protein